MREHRRRHTMTYILMYVLTSSMFSYSLVKQFIVIILYQHTRRSFSHKPKLSTAKTLTSAHFLKRRTTSTSYVFVMFFTFLLRFCYVFVMFCHALLISGMERVSIKDRCNTQRLYIYIPYNEILIISIIFQYSTKC